MKPNTKEAYQLLHDGVLALFEAEQQGLRIDVKYIQGQNEAIGKRVRKLEKEIYKSSFYKGWQKSLGKEPNIYSHVQLRNYLYSVKNIKVKKETKISGQGSTDEETLRSLNIPECNKLLEIKKLKKIRDTYLSQFMREQVGGIVHPFFNLQTVRSFRSSSDRPNFQNIPSRDQEAVNIVRKAIYPRPGHQFLELDYKQLEVRIAASYSKDERLVHDIIKGDMHRDMAVEIFKIDKFDVAMKGHTELRKAAKNGFVFPQFYGDYYKNCAEHLACTWGGLSKGRWKEGQGINFNGSTLSDHLIGKGIKSYLSFETHIKKIEERFWTQRYSGYYKWREMVWEKYQKKGYVESKTGFVYRGLMKKNDVINYPIQGSGFHCLLWSLIQGVKAQKRGRWDSRVVSQIHDSIIFDIDPHELEKVIKVMRCIMCNDVRQHWKWIVVPLDISAELCPVDGSWAEKQEITLPL